MPHISLEWRSLDMVTLVSREETWGCGPWEAAVGGHGVGGGGGRGMEGAGGGAWVGVAWVPQGRSLPGVNPHWVAWLGSQPSQAAWRDLETWPCTCAVCRSRTIAARLK